MDTVLKKQIEYLQSEVAKLRKDRDNVRKTCDQHTAQREVFLSSSCTFPLAVEGENIICLVLEGIV